MSYRCDHCDKKTIHGERHTHGRGVASHKFHKRAPRTKRLFKPNLHNARIMVNGVMKKMRLCTKCLRKLKKNMISSKNSKS